MRAFSLIALALTESACAGSRASSTAAEPNAAATKSTPTAVLTSEVEWEQLNPARGDESPMAGTLWGDRDGPGPTGFLVKFVDGFESPPHVHNVSYTGVVIGGLIHNDDPNAEEIWMPAGSFWTQPRGAVHITAAKGNSNLAYIEIEEGPYLVHPVEKAFDSGEEPVNIVESNIVWLDASNTGRIEPPGIAAAAGGLKVALLWGKPQGGQLNGTFIKLPAGATGKVNIHGSTFRAVVVRGRLNHRVPGGSQVQTMEPGSFLGSNREAEHLFSCEVEEDCVIYVRTKGTLDFVPALPDQ